MPMAPGIKDANIKLSEGSISISEKSITPELLKETGFTKIVVRDRKDVKYKDK